MPTMLFCDVCSARLHAVPGGSACPRCGQGGDRRTPDGATLRLLLDVCAAAADLGAQADLDGDDGVRVETVDGVVVLWRAGATSALVQPATGITARLDLEDSWLGDPTELGRAFTSVAVRQDTL